MNRDDILAAYRQFAQSTADDRPPGMNQFLRAYPEVSQHAFRSGFWRTWRSFQTEAGVAPNTINARHPDQEVVASLARLARTLDRVPSSDDVAFARRHDKSFPSDGAIRTRASTLPKRAELLRAFCEQNTDWQDVLSLLPAAVDRDRAPVSVGKIMGYVYLMKDGSRFKIGHTNSVGRREAEAATWLINARIIHDISTDDPEGVERYWHRRFEPKSIEREWFALDAVDVAAFRRWKKII